MEYSSQDISGNEKRYERLLQNLTDYIYTVHIYKGEVINTVHGPGVVSVTGYTSRHFAEDPELWYRMIPDEERDMIIDRARRAVSGECSRPGGEPGFELSASRGSSARRRPAGSPCWRRTTAAGGRGRRRPSRARSTRRLPPASRWPAPCRRGWCRGFR